MRVNILFFLLPKASVTYVYDDFSVRQAMEKHENCGYTALPILTREGGYRGVITEGDLLWALKNQCGLDLRKAEECRIMDIPHRQDNRPVKASTQIRDLVASAVDQNFVPVIDDREMFIGIVTRKSIIEHFQQTYLT